MQNQNHVTIHLAFFSIAYQNKNHTQALNIDQGLAIFIYWLHVITASSMSF
jgi:hypothetical protein